MESELRRYRSSCDLEQCGTYEGDRYRSQWYQGLEEQMEWLRLSLDGPADLHVRVYVCDRAPGDPGQPAMERRANDLLLYGVRGKYLSFTVEPCRELRGFTLEFPGHSIGDGLPSAMQGDETLRQLLGVYQSGFMDLNQAVRRFTRKLDTESPQVLPQLSRWLGAERWTLDQGLFHKVLPYAHELARLRGTRKGLILLSEIVTGTPCQIVEGWQLARRDMRQRREDRALFGRTGEEVTILVPPQVSRAAVGQFRSLLTDFMPLGVRWNMVYLAEYAPMDGHSYLDWNVLLQGHPISLMDGPVQDEVILE